MSNSGWGRGRTVAGRLVAVMVVMVVGGCAGSSVPTARQTASWTPTAIPWMSTGPTEVASPTPEFTPGAWPTTTPGPGAFTVTEGMLPASFGPATPALLPDGRVLFVGGMDEDTSGQFSKVAWVYNPADDSFKEAASMSSGQYCPVVTTLRDGRVLVAGGSYTSAAELYAPATGKFTLTGSSLADWPCAKGVLLGNGEVLVFGSAEDARVQLYSPVTGKFRWGSVMPTKAENRTATALPDGRVLFVGGGLNGIMTGPLEVYAKAEIYDPATGKFTATGPMAQARQQHAAALLADGRVLIAGGSDPKGTLLNTAEIWDPKTGKFSATGSMTSARSAAGAATLKDGRVLLVGGQGDDYSGLVFGELYNPATGKFTRTGSMAAERYRPSATLLNNGRVLVGGGYGDGPSAELYWP